MGNTLVFVSCADSGELHVLHLASDTRQLHTEQVLALGGQLMPMALSPDGTRLYVARRSDPLAEQGHTYIQHAVPQFDRAAFHRDQEHAEDQRHDHERRHDPGHVQRFAGEQQARDDPQRQERAHPGQP